MKLDLLQQNFIEAIFNSDRETALEHVIGDDNLNASQRLNIYRGSVHGILTKSLGDTFSVTKQLLGDEFFDKMCDRFIDQYPPSTPFFSDYGDNLSVFLRDFEPVQTIPFISDVADFEWSRHRVWQQTPIETFDFSQIASLNEEQQSKLVFHLNRTLHLFESNYRIDLIWFAHQENSDIDLEEIDINDEIRLLIWKADNTVKITNLDTNDENSSLKGNEDVVIFDNNNYWDFLKAISSKSNITDLATQFDEKFPGLLNKSIQDGWIESFTCK